MNEHGAENGNSLLADLIGRLLKDNPGRVIQSVEGVRWGELISPANDENPEKTGNGLRVLAICSWTLGMLALDTLKLIESRHPSNLCIVGLVTDDPVDSKARITAKKRFWRYYGKDRQEEYEKGTVESALSFGIPCYTGEVKSDPFRDLLASWDPELIIVAAFGQLIDRPIIEYPRFGIYNVHPADLLHDHGAGPQPWEDLVARKASTTRVAIHRVSEEIDSGEVVGESPPINVQLEDGNLSDDVRLIGEKTLMPVGHMVAELVLEVIRRKKSGRIEPVEEIDFNSLFSGDFKERLLEPIDPSRRGDLLPLPLNERSLNV